MSSWVVKESTKRPGVPYYFNMKTGETQWEKPAEMEGAGVPAAASSSSSSAPTSVRASHILVKHTGSRRPSSWRCPTVTLTKAEALEKLAGIRASIVAGTAQFEAVAAKESDCSSAQQGGDLGSFTRGKMQKPFEDASFALQVGQLSEVVVSGPPTCAPPAAHPLLSLSHTHTLTLPTLVHCLPGQDTESGVHIVSLAPGARPCACPLCPHLTPHCHVTAHAPPADQAYSIASRGGGGGVEGRCAKLFYFFTRDTQQPSPPPFLQPHAFLPPLSAAAGPGPAPASAAAGCVSSK
jgi:NIMA-interacting peptidyl-prolyl cis-trans isomerase 1